MKIKNMMAAFAVMTMAATPVLAAPTNPAASLSVARASTPSAKKSNLAGFAGAGILALLVVAGVAAIIIVDATTNDSSDSN